MWGQLDYSHSRKRDARERTGMMIEFLKQVGTTEVARDSLNSEVNKPASWSEQDLRTWPVIRSGCFPGVHSL